MELLRSKMAIFCALVFAGLFITACVASTNQTVDFECSSSGVISVTNPNTTIYIWAHANTSDTNCTTNVISGKILIYDCFNRDITLLLSDVIGIPEIIKEVHKTYTLSCSAIPETGIVKKVIDDTHVINHFSTSIVPAEIVFIYLNSSLVDSDSVEKAIAYLGEPFYWYIWGPEGYTLKPLDCTTYSVGADPVFGTEFAVDTHTDGCTLDASFMTDFRRYNESENLVVSDLYAFRFPGSDQIRLYCNVLVCPVTTPDACEINCTSTRKKRSDDTTSYYKSENGKTGTNGPSGYPKTTPVSVDTLSRPKRRWIREKRGRVNAWLTVIGEPNVPVERYLYFGGTGSSVELSRECVAVILFMSLLLIR